MEKKETESLKDQSERIKKRVNKEVERVLERVTQSVDTTNPNLATKHLLDMITEIHGKQNANLDTLKKIKDAICE